MKGYGGRNFPTESAEDGNFGMHFIEDREGHKDLLHLPLNFVFSVSLW
jgi:hypothetical protein